jgi:hypothetical protein
MSLLGKFRETTDQFIAAANAKLHVYSMGVLFDRALADIELPCDSFVAVAAANEGGNLTLAARKGAEVWGHCEGCYRNHALLHYARGLSDATRTRRLGYCTRLAVTGAKRAPAVRAWPSSSQVMVCERQRGFEPETKARPVTGSGDRPRSLNTNS